MVLAVGLWLRFDPDTANLLAENDAPEHFFIGELQIFFEAHSKCLRNSFVGFINIVSWKQTWGFLGEETTL